MSSRLRLLLLVLVALTFFLAAAAAQVASAGEPPCPSCPDQVPPPGASGGGAGGGGQSGGAGPNGGQAAQPVPPLVSLGPITVTDGVASVTGVVNGVAGGAVSLVGKVKVTVNTAPVSLSVNGQFAASVDLDAHAAIVVRAGDKADGQSYTITIPTAAIPAGGVAADALARLDADAVTLMIPPDGLTIVDGLDVQASVRVKAIAGIAGLTLNGANVLAKLRIGRKAASGTSNGSSGSSSSSGSNGSSGSTGGSGVKPGSGSPACRHAATARVAGTSKTVNLTVTGTNGASQTTTVAVKRVRSVIRFGRQFSISAFGARGVKITGVRFATYALGSSHRLGVTVTVRDRRNYLVRDAVVMLQPTARKTSIHGTAAKMTDMLGRARFSMPVSHAAIGHKLYLTVLARTPRASTHLTRSVQLRTAR